MIPRQHNKIDHYIFFLKIEHHFPMQISLGTILDSHLNFYVPQFDQRITD